MTFKLKHALLLAFLLSIMSGVLTANCTSTINDYIKYLTTSDPGFSRSLAFQMSSMKGPAKFVGYSTGSLTVAYYRLLGSFAFSQPYLLGKDAKTVFSDRTWCPQLPPGEMFCFGYQRFDYRKADSFQLSLFTNSTAKVVLTTWGNATYRFPLQCKDGFLYGTMRESNGNSFMTISIRQDRYQIPR